MRRIISIAQTGIVAGVLSSLAVVNLLTMSQAQAASAPSLVISQAKITSSNGQFITLYNSTDSVLDMSKYQLEYFNSYDLSKATSSKLIALSGVIPPHGYFMVNDAGLLLCYQLTVNSVSLGFSSTSGMVQVLGLSQNGPGGSVVQTVEDYVAWSKTPVAGAQTVPSNVNAFLQRQPVDTLNNPNIATPGIGSWQSVQPDPANPCRLISTINPALEVETGLDQLLPAGEAPAIIVSVAAGAGQTAPTMPVGNIGLKAPSITELLPNPSGTGNDDTDEYIELHNSNAKVFDLSGFKLQTGTSTFRNFTFPTGTTIPPQSFMAFHSDKTGLTLSNSGSQVKLLDPFGNSISTSGMYGTAKDGQAWAQAKGKWYWTSELTPGKANVIKQPTTTKKGSTKKSTSKSKKNTANTATKLSSSNQPDDEAGLTPIHPLMLAIVGGLALLYGAYEYRADLANRIHELKRNVTARRSSRT